MSVTQLLRSCLPGLLFAPALALAVDLYQPGEYQSLTSDRRAKSIGDVLTVLVVENASASASAGSATDKDGGPSVSISTPDRQRAYSASLAEQFDSSGTIARSGRLLAQLSVTVTGIAPNGDLLVAGAQAIEINDEKQAIDLKGRVRPVDVSDANTVLSSRIADARITYVGEGVLTENQRKGWISRILSFLGLL